MMGDFSFSNRDMVKKIDIESRLALKVYAANYILFLPAPLAYKTLVRNEYNLLWSNAGLVYYLCYNPAYSGLKANLNPLKNRLLRNPSQTQYVVHHAL